MKQKYRAIVQTRESGGARASIDVDSVFEYRYAIRSEGPDNKTREARHGNNIIKASEWVSTGIPSRIETRPGVRRYDSAQLVNVYDLATPGLKQWATTAAGT